MGTVIVVTVQHRVVNQLHLLLLVMMWSHLRLSRLTLPHRRRIRTLYIPHEISHQFLTKSIQRTPTHLFLPFAFLLIVQRITNWLHNLFLSTLLPLDFLFHWGTHGVALHLNILLNLIFFVALHLVSLTEAYRIGHSWMLEEFAVRKGSELLT